jgi:DnaK suppressor protein
MSTPFGYSKEDLAYFEDMITKRRADLVEQLSQVQNASRFGGGDIRSDLSSDSATDMNMIETSFNLAQRESDFLVYLEEALLRIKKGTYGICKGSTDENPHLIPKMRLEAVPTASKCVHCKENSKVKEKAALTRAYNRYAAAQQASASSDD